MVPLVFLAAALACLVYWAAERLHLAALISLPPRRRTLLSPVEDWLQRELDQAGWPVPAPVLLWATAAAAGLGALVAAPFASVPLLLVCMAAGGLAPAASLRARQRRRARAIRRAAAPALAQIARLCEIRRHPFLAISDAVPLLAQPLKREFQRALAECQTGLPLPDALRQLAARCGHDFSLHQLAELVAMHLRDGGDLSGELERLAARLRTLEEVRADEAAALSGYRWVTRTLLPAALLPLPYWALTRAPSLGPYLHEPAFKAVLVWVVVSGLVIVSLPYWLAIEE